MINQNAEQDLNMQLKNQQNKAEKFFPAAGTQGESQSQEDNVMQSEDLQADSDYLGDGAASNQFLQEQEQDAEYDDGANEQLDMQEERRVKEIIKERKEEKREKKYNDFCKEQRKDMEDTFGKINTARQDYFEKN